MNNLGFILGREREISLAEIAAVFEREKIDFNVELLSKDVLIISSEYPNLNKLSIGMFGGVIKLFKVVAENATKSELIEIVENISLPQKEKRINFGISGYGNISQKEIFNLGKIVKENFSEQKISSRFVTGKYKDLTSVIVHENKLLERGFEAIIVENKSKYVIGQTIEVQNYKAYSKFDYGRPNRDDKAGMIPPKLAQMMINISKAETEEIIYDPFCGSGTILSEALILGFENIFGSDISEKAITDSKANLTWVEQNFDTKISPSYDVFLSDVLNPVKVIKAKAIVGEGYLGEPIRRTKDQAMTDAKTLAVFYEEAIKNLAKMLEPKGRMIFAVPFFIVKNEFIYLPIQGLNLIRINPVEKFGLKLPGRSNLTYFRKDQFVGREILVLEKNET